MMLLANFISGLFYATSYPYIYAETIKVVPRQFLGLEQILCCVSTIIFCRLWNKYSDRFFNHYHLILWAEIIADTILFFWRNDTRRFKVLFLTKYCNLLIDNQKSCLRWHKNASKSKSDRKIKRTL